jgi:hypothetical protein
MAQFRGFCKDYGKSCAVVYRNKQLLEIVRVFPCQHCGIQDGTIVAAHSNQLRDGKGKGIKAHDYRIASLCHKCHHEIDQGSKLSKAERLDIWEEAHRKTIALLFEQGFLHTKV